MRTFTRPRPKRARLAAIFAALVLPLGILLGLIAPASASPAARAAGPPPRTTAAAAIAAHLAAAEAPAETPAQEICQTDRGQLCLNPKGGSEAAGAEVIGYFQGDANNTFQLLPLSGMCGNGHVNAKANCPSFGPSEVTASVDGAILVALYDYRAGLCVAAGGQLATCPTYQGFDGDGGAKAMVFAAANCGTYTECSITSFLNQHWSQYNAAARWLWIPTVAAQRVNLGYSSISEYAWLITASSTARVRATRERLRLAA
jgi:hypothetical protein